MGRLSVAAKQYHQTPKVVQDEVTALARHMHAQDRAICLLVEEITRLREACEGLEERIRKL